MSLTRTIRKATFLVCAAATQLLGCSDWSHGSDPADQPAIGTVQLGAGTSNIVSQNGQLSVQNGKLTNQSGAVVQLRGWSNGELQWFPSTAQTVSNLVDNFDIQLIRAPVGVDECGGYVAAQNCSAAPDTMKARARTVVDAAIASGAYVLLDWHVLQNGDPNVYKWQAKEFFEYMANLYKNYPNIIYEICNEPNGGNTGYPVTWSTIKQYADFIIPAIRAIDSDAVIVVGTPNWSSSPQDVLANRLTYPNIMYTTHIYACTSKQEQIDNFSGLLSQGLPLFMTEWGTTDYTGNGAECLDSAENWTNWMAQNQISWAKWAWGNAADTSYALQAGVDLNGPWDDSQLKPGAIWARDEIRRANPSPPPSGSATGTNPVNLARGKPTDQSSTCYSGSPSRAVDGNTDGVFSDGSVTHTCGATAFDWWKVDLGVSQPIGQVRLWNRTDCCSNRLNNVDVKLSNDAANWTTVRNLPGQIGTSASVDFGGVAARYVLVQRHDASAATGDDRALSLSEVEVFSAGSPQVGSGYYQLRVGHTDKCLDVAAGSGADGAQVQQWSCTGGANQHVQLQDMGGGMYRVMFRHSQKCLDVQAVSPSWGYSNGDALQQWTCHTGDNQQWTLRDEGSGRFKLVSRRSGRVADVLGASTADGAKVVQWDDLNGAQQGNQVWHLVAVP